VKSSLARLAAELNRVKVTVEDLLTASEAIHDLPVEDRDWEGRAHCLVLLYRKAEPGKAMAVGKRLEAMAAVIQSGALPGWLTAADEDGAISIAEPVFIAAALEPLLVTERDAYFQQDNFVNAVMRHAQPEGNA
jgi:hypothetical protein